MAVTRGHQGREERLARNQALFREVNERVIEIRQAHELSDLETNWVCECADQGCLERIALAPSEYESIRREPTRFLVAPGEEHVVPEIDRVVDKTDRYWVVEKAGEAATLTKQLDPRSSPTRTARR
jgi:hypothetical protein